MEILVRILLDVVAAIFVVGFLFAVLGLLIIIVVMLGVSIFKRLKSAMLFFSWNNKFLKPWRRNFSLADKTGLKKLSRQYFRHP